MHKSFVVIILCLLAGEAQAAMRPDSTVCTGEDSLSVKASAAEGETPDSVRSLISLYRVSSPGLRSGTLLSPMAEGSDPVPFEGYDPENTQVRWGRLAGIGLVAAGVVTAVHIYQKNAWWQNDSCGFHVVPDPEYALNVDKVGHFHGGAFTSFLGQKAMIWSGFSREAAVWGGFAIGALFELYVEFEDGFACDWGFSPGDAAADIVGASWPVLQYYVPAMHNVWPKISYWPSQTYRDGIHKGNAIDDYNGQTYWMGVHPYGWLPRSWQSYWPSWLGFSVGIAVRNMKTEEPLEKHVFIALDYDMTKILPGDSWFMHTFKEALNFIHFPSPAIRISPSFIGYGLYF